MPSSQLDELVRIAEGIEENNRLLLEILDYLRLLDAHAHAMHEMYDEQHYFWHLQH